MNKKPRKHSDANNRTPSKSVPGPATDAKEPVFSADALTKLTQKIQSGFNQTSNSKPAATPKKDKAEKKSRKERKAARDGEKAEQPKPAAKPGKPPKSNPNDTAIKPQKTSRLESRPSKPTKNDTAHGKKHSRESDGNSKPAKPQPAHEARKSKPPQNGTARSTVLPTKPGSKHRIDKDALLKEILELGGTQEDLDLVNGIDSESEEETIVQESGKVGKDVRKDIESFMKDIGLEPGKLDTATVEDSEATVEDEEWEDDEEDDDEDEDENDEGEEEDEDDEMDDAEGAEDDVEMEDQNPPATVSTTASKGSKLVFSPRPDWHAEPLPSLTPPTSPLSPETIAALHERGKTLLQAENSLYSATNIKKSSDRQFLSTIMNSGTLNDKISALTLICQESPLHTTKTLENLLGLAQKKARTQAVAALRAIKDLFASGVVLPPDRKLKPFARQPGLGARDCKDVHLLVWAYEDWLKGFYFQVLLTLEQICADQLPFARNNGVSFLYELLKEKPEQEAALLRLLVNKLGDTDKKIASKVSYLLLQLQNAHPAMKSIIINSVESEVLFRPGNNVHAKYYAIITLNQTMLQQHDTEVANKLLNIYFAVFTSLLKKEESTAKVSGKHTKFSEQDDKDKKMSKKARAKAQKEEEHTQFEEEVNAKLISGVLTGVNRAFPFSKVDDEVFEKHMATLFRITHTGNFNTSVQALMLIYQVSSSKQTVSDRFYRTLYESLLDQRLMNSSKQVLYLNLLFKALKADTSIKRVKAFVKRIIQSATFHQPPFICAALYLLHELETAMPTLRSLYDTPEENEDDEEEVFRDVPEEDEEDSSKKTQEETPKAGPKTVEYDGRKRDPLHANADRSCIWELMPFLSHFHPTVSLFATHLLENKAMPSKPDLTMHTLSHFLDRFVYRNPKGGAPTARGASIMQPLAGGRSMGMVLASKDKGKGLTPVNSEAFWRRKVEDVGADEVFFHQYFNNQDATATAQQEKKNKRKRGGDEEEDESEGEGEIWKALVESRPELEGDEGSVDFDDDDMSGLDESDGGMELGDDDEDVWDTEDEGREGGNSDEDDEESADEGDLAQMFEQDLAKASAKRQKMLDREDDDESEEEEELSERELRKQENKKKRRKLKHLPTFASAEDYMHMLSDSD